jgi:hypothetical protein
VDLEGQEDDRLVHCDSDPALDLVMKTLSKVIVLTSGYCEGASAC